MLGLSQCGAVARFVQPKRGLHARLLVKHFPNRGRLVAAMFLIRQLLKGPVQGEGKRDRDSRGFLIPHVADRFLIGAKQQGNSALTLCMTQ
jgi:hypothetical protein